MVCTPHNTLI